MPFLVALALCSGLTPLLGRIGLRLGLVDRPSQGGLKIHTEPKPITGGIGVVAGTVAGVVVAGDLPVLGTAAAVLSMLVVGIADDLRPMPPLVRLLAQLGAGVLLAFGGATFEPLEGFGPLAVVLAVPVLSNAVNIVDGQDGLATGLALLAASGIWAIGATQGDVDPIAPALVGALLGFMLWNRPPASVFLGDGGAYAVGCTLAVIAAGTSGTWETLLGTMLCFGVFAVELCSTVLRRAGGKGSILAGDRAHLYDVAALRLGSRERATAGMLAAAALAALVGWLVAMASLPIAVAVSTVAALGGWIAARAVLRTSLRRSR